nr:CMESO_453 [Cryptomonas curvata]
MNKIFINQADHWNISLTNPFYKFSLNKINSKNFQYGKQDNFELAGFSIDTGAWIYSKRVDELFEFTRGFLDSLEKRRKQTIGKKKDFIVIYDYVNYQKLTKSNIDWKNSSFKLSNFLNLKKGSTFMYRNNCFENVFLIKLKYLFNYLELKIIVPQDLKINFKLVSLLDKFSLKNCNFSDFLFIYQKKLQSKTLKTIKVRKIIFPIKNFQSNSFNCNDLNLLEKNNQLFHKNLPLVDLRGLTDKGNFLNQNFIFNKKLGQLDLKYLLYKKNEKKKFFYEEKRILGLKHIQIGFFEKFKFRKVNQFFFLFLKTKFKLNFKSYIWIIEKKKTKNINKYKFFENKLDFLNEKVLNLELKKKNQKKENNSIFYTNKSMGINLKFFYYKNLLKSISNYCKKISYLFNKKLKLNCNYIFFNYYTFFSPIINYFGFKNNLKKNIYIIILDYFKNHNYPKTFFLTCTSLNKFFILYH